MTPNFALSLSFEGIRLLHRVTGGWTLAGEVSLDAADLGAEMKTLLATATGLEPDGLRTKLLLPNDQIKYIAIDTTRTTLDQIHEAVDQATPISLNDLVIDFDRSGGRTQIAAVARQTLEEAEDFAKQYGFEPMTYVAVAEPLTFSTEVFFGPTAYAREVHGVDVEFTRDDSPAVIKSTGTLPGFMKIPTVDALAPDDAATTPDEPELSFEAPVSEPAPVDETKSLTTPDLTLSAESEQTDTQQDDTLSETEADNETVSDAPELIFRRAPEPDAGSPSENVGVDTPDDISAVEDTQTDGALAAAPEDEPVFASRTRGVEITRARRVPDEPDLVASAETEDLPQDTSRAPDPIAMFTRSVPARSTTETSEPNAPAIPEPIKAPAPLSEVTPTVTAAPLRHPKPDLSPEEDDKVGPFAPIFGIFARKEAPAPTNADLALGGTKGRKTAAVGGKPKHLGLIMTAALLMFMLIAAMWASSQLENGIAGLFRTPGVVEDVATLQDEAPVAPTTVEVAAATPVENTSSEAEPTTPRQPIVTTIPGTVLSPAEAARIYAATGVWQRAPRLPDASDTGTLDGLLAFAALPTAAAIALPAKPEINVAAPDSAILAPQNPRPANRPMPRDANGFILAASNGTIMPTGVWVYGRKPQITPPLRPGTEALVIPTAAAVPDTLVVETTPIEETSDEIAEVLQPTAPDTIAEQPTDQAPATVAPETSETGPEFETAAAAPTETIPVPDVATATAPPTNEIVAPELSNDDLVVIAGSPALIPPLRPGSAPPDASAEVGDLLGNDPALASFRPALRPSDLVPAPPPEPFADPDLAGFRPSVRPAGLAPAPVEEDVPEIAAEDVPEETPATSTDISSIVASIAAAAPPSQIVTPTRNAIVASPRPGSRPQNFARVVSSAQTRSAAQQSRDVAAATAAAAVPAAPAAPVATAPARASGPTTATVAQAATLSNAIRLRDMNLIGVYGRPGDRRALIRLSNGRFVKVEVGSSLDGGRVTAIGDSALNFVKRGQTFALQLPSG